MWGVGLFPRKAACSSIILFGFEIKMLTIIKSIRFILYCACIIFIVIGSSSCKSEKKQKNNVYSTSLAVLLAMNAANADFEKDWSKPEVESWTGNVMMISGIKPSQIDEFFVWSIDRSQLMWWLSPKNRREDYTKESCNEKFLITYGVSPKEWRQRYPKKKCG